METLAKSCLLDKAENFVSLSVSRARFLPPEWSLLYGKTFILCDLLGCLCKRPPRLSPAKDFTIVISLPFLVNLYRIMYIPYAKRH